MRASTIDLWLEDYDEFNQDFRRNCFKLFQAFGLSADFIPNALKGVHQQWVDDHRDWMANQVDKSERLSHLKIISLLLYNLCKIPFLGNMKNHDYSASQEFFAKATGESYEKNRRDIIDGREIVISFDFCFMFLDAIERNRRDRDDQYVMPLTEDMRHDFIVYLTSKEPEREAVYLIFKALFLRKMNKGSHN